MTDVKLKPCPFCGGEATIQNEGTEADITCDSCYASNNIQISDFFTYEERHNNPDFKWLDAPIYGYAPGGKQRAIDILTDLWNVRASDSTIEAQEAEINRLREALEFYATRKAYDGDYELYQDAGRIAQAALARIKE